MTTTPTRRQRRKLNTLRNRRYLYGIAVAAVPVAVVYGLATADQMAPLLGLAAAVLGVGGVALANPTAD